MATQKWVRVASMQTSPSRVRPSLLSTMRRETSSESSRASASTAGRSGPMTCSAPRELGRRPVVGHIDGQVAALHRAEEDDAVGEQRHALVGVAVKRGPQLADGEACRRGLGAASMTSRTSSPGASLRSIRLRTHSSSLIAGPV